MIMVRYFIDYRFIQHPNILFYFIQPIGLEKEDVEKILAKEDLKGISDTGFLEKKTYYRLKEENLCQK